MTSLFRSIGLALVTLTLLVACDGGGGSDAGLDGTIAPPDAPPPDAGPPCTTDEECNDSVPCTLDSCGANGRCRNTTDTGMCDNGVFCDGVEICDPRRGGCVPGPRETCNDTNVCTLDRCDEEARLCRHSDRDLDLDGDADWFCSGGGDCNDTDPTVSSLVSEVCSDFVDNDCDDMVDESVCGRPRNDTCDDALDVSEGGFYTVTTDGATPDYSTSCAGAQRDLVLSFTLAEPRSVRIEAEADFFTVTLSLRTSCADSTSEITCEAGFPGVIRRRQLPAGTYYVIVGGFGTGEIGVTVDFDEPIAPAPNDSCASPTDVTAGGRFDGSMVEVADDTAIACGFFGAADLLYTFTTTEVQDVVISAQAPTREGMAVSVRSVCGDDASAVRCVYGDPAAGRLHELPPGTYYIVVEGPSWVDVDFTLDVEFLPPTPAVAGDQCDNPLPLPVGTDVIGTFAEMENDVLVACGAHYRDVVHTFTLDEAADITLTYDPGAYGSISLRTVCDGTGTEVRCGSGDPVRQRIRGLPSGTYYVVAESSRSSGYQLNLEVTTPPTIPIEVSGNENCASAHVVTTAGGLFHGNTTGMLADYDSPLCFFGAASRDAAFSLTLASRQRVVASTEGSAFDTVLHVHRDACVDGGGFACDDDSGDGSAGLLDRVLDPGTWYFIVDGWGSSAGDYYFELFVTDP